MTKLNVGEESSPTNVYIRAATLGFVAGLRSMTPLTLLSWMGRLNANPVTESSSILSRLDSRGAQVVTTLLAVGELFGDKLPVIPSRISLGPLGGRIVIGAMAGMIICQEYSQPPVPGAILGGASAALGSYAGNSLRSGLGKATNVPDFAWAVAEDALALSLGLLATRKK